MKGVFVLVVVFFALVHAQTYPNPYDPYGCPTPCSGVVCPDVLCGCNEEKVIEGCCPVCKPLCRWDYLGNATYGCTKRCSCEGGTSAPSCTLIGRGRCGCQRECVVGRVTYQSGAEFSDNCGRKCKCQDGVVTCACTTRREIRQLTQAEVTAFINAMKSLKAAGGYDIFVNWHMSTPGIHGAALFGPWHREYLRRFEVALREASGNCAISIPYWDWTKDAANPGASIVFGATYFGGSGFGQPGQCVATGPFAGVANWNTGTVPSPQCLRRTFNVLPPFPNAASVAGIMGNTPYNSFRPALESIHNSPHSLIGGHMGGYASPWDPLFWLHHAFIDKLWADWQALSAANAASYDPATINTIMSPFGVTPASVLNSTALGVCYSKNNTKVPGLGNLPLSVLELVPRTRFPITDNSWFTDMNFPSKEIEYARNFERYQNSLPDYEYNDGVDIRYAYEQLADYYGANPNPCRDQY